MFKLRKKIKDDDIISSAEIDNLMFKDWPLNVEKCIIQKRGTLLSTGKIGQSMLYVTLVINGKVIGLNGASVDKYKLKSVLDSKHYIKGESVSELIEFGLKLS